MGGVTRRRSSTWHRATCHTGCASPRRRKAILESSRPGQPSTVKAEVAVTDKANTGIEARRKKLQETINRQPAVVLPLADERTKTPIGLTPVRR